MASLSSAPVAISIEHHTPHLNPTQQAHQAHHTSQPSEHSSEQSVASAQPSVSAGNPCPFLRGLVAQGLLPDGQATSREIIDAVHKIQKLNGSPNIPGLATGLKAVVAIGNGLNPRQVVHNIRQGVHLDQLRYGPLYKNGVHSGVLNEQGQIDAVQLARLDQFASPKVSRDGQQELGFNQQELDAMMDANVERATPEQRRHYYRKMMDFEFPVLLKIMGKQGQAEPYLGLDDVKRLFVEGRFPHAIQQQLDQP